LNDQPLIRVLKKEKPGRRPIWFMRQAGRYLPEYKKTREQAGSFLELCYSPGLAAEVTLQPLRRYDLDAAIIFADILVVPHAMGNGLSFVEGEGPKLETVRGADDVKRLKPGAQSVQYKSVAQSISNVRGQLSPHISLIGFCGAPWTVASYMIEGGGSDRELARSIAYRREPWLFDLMAMLVQSSIDYLCLQIEAGADALQIFDSWAGELSPESFTEFSVEPIRQIIAGVKSRFPAIPVIVFAKGAGYRHREIQEKTDCDGVGVEPECSLVELRTMMPAGSVLQGNLDPLLLLCPEDIVREHVTRMTQSMPMASHIFNLGHGIRQQTRPEMLSVVVDAVRAADKGQ
jgi:uroporphyrinogen decarboxylase